MAFPDWHVAFFPPLSWALPDIGKVSGLFFLLAAVLLPNLCFGVIRISRRFLKKQHWLYVISTGVISAGMTILAVRLLHAFPAGRFNLLEVPLLLLIFGRGIAMVSTASWIHVKDRTDLDVPFFSYIKANTWLLLQFCFHVIVPIILLQMPVFNAQGRSLYWGVPLLMVAAYWGYGRLLLPRLLDLIRLNVPPRGAPRAAPGEIRLCQPSPCGQRIRSCGHCRKRPLQRVDLQKRWKGGGWL